MLRKRFVIFIIYLIIINFAIFSASNELLAKQIFYATNEDLINMAIDRGVLNYPTDTNELKEMMYLLEDIEFIEEKTSSDFEIFINNADSVKVLPSGDTSLKGNVRLDIQKEGKNLTLTANEIIINSDIGKISALGNVNYIDNDINSSVQNINADIVTFLYDNDELYISKGVTVTEKTTNEDDKVSLYTTGELISYRANSDGMFFKDGMITSNIEDAYSSIKASEIAILSSGDMFISNAIVSIGRVPILYMPFFFFPSTRLSFNPSFGFESERGIFLSSTYDIFGTNTNLKEAEQSSFSSLLQVESDNDLVSNGLYYEKRDKENESNFQKWVRETKSYLSILLDVYSISGINLGYETEINYEDILSFDSRSSLIHSKSPEFNNLRYFTDTDIEFNPSFAKLSISIPYYSDPNVFKDYANRLSGLSLDALFGKAQKFPTDYSSTYNSFDMNLIGSIYLPSNLTSNYISNLKLSNVKLNANYTWSNYDKEYEITNLTIPSFDFIMKGELLNLNFKQEVISEEKSYSYFDYFSLDDPLLRKMYETIENTNKAKTMESNISLSYELDESLKHIIDLENNDKKFDSFTDVSFILKSNYTNYISMNSRLKLNNDYSDKNGNEFEIFNFLNISSPFIGFSYNFDSILYSQDKNGQKDISFTKEFITGHNISLSKSFSFNEAGIFNAGFKYILPPFDDKIELDAGYSIMGFKISLGLNLSNINFKDLTNLLSLSYNYDCFDVSFSSKVLNDNFSFTTSFACYTKDQDYMIREYLSFEDNKVQNLKTSINIPYLSFDLNFKNINNEFKADYFDIDLNFEDLFLYAWYNRIVFKTSINTGLYYDLNNPYSISFNFDLSLTFKIQEYIDLSINFETGNNGFYNYYINDEFSIKALWKDLLNSFDLFGDGINNTNFNMNGVSIELVHFMKDWDLHVKYGANVQKSSTNYQWTPKFSIFLKWKTMPDLKIDEEWKYTDSGYIKVGT